MSNNWISLIFLGGWGAPQPGWPCMSFSIKGAIKLIIACAHPFFNDFCKIPQKNCKYFSCVQEGKKGKKEKRLTAQAAEPAARARSSARQLALSVLYQLLLAYLIFSLNIWWKFAEIWWKIAKLRSARSRSYQRMFEFFLRVRWEGVFNSQFP